jgi:hypothetical protein
MHASKDLMWWDEKNFFWTKQGLNKIKSCISVTRKMNWLKDRVIISATRNIIFSNIFFLWVANSFCDFYLFFLRRTADHSFSGIFNVLIK